MKKGWAGLLLAVGGLTAATGVGLVFMYIRDAVINRIGEPDQSLLFWYLPLLFLGLFAAAGGLTLLIYAIRRLKG